MLNLIKKYLDVSQFSSLKTDFEDLFLSHPNYPSVFAITDSLDALSIENIAIKIPKEQFVALPEYFLAIFNNDMVLVTKSNVIVSIETQKENQQKLSFNDFLTGWNEVIIAIEPNKDAIIKNKKTNTNTKWLLYTLPAIALIILSIAYNNYYLYSIILLTTSFVGFIFSVFIVQEKLGIKNEMATKFCNMNPKTTCESVIKSDKGELNKWVGFSDLPLLFFGTSIAAIIIQPEAASSLIGCLGLFSIPVVGYSVWLQKFKIKKWCMLCLAVSLIIVLQILVFGFATTSFFSLELANFFGFLFSGILLTTIWMFTKPVVEAKIKVENEVIELKKFKRNYEVFNFLGKDILSLNEFDKLKGLQFGKKTASVHLTIIISPSCGHCHNAFEDGFDLVTKFPEKVFLNVLFNINPENTNNPYKEVVENLLSINNINPENAKKAISDWHIKKVELEPWLKKWKRETIDMEVKNQLIQQYNWCVVNGFNYTPVKIVNNKRFSNGYYINDLKYFLNDFSKKNEAIDILVET